MHKILITVGILSLLLAGCGSHPLLSTPNGGSQSPRSAGGSVRPFVLQNGKTPVQWTQFAWGGSASGPDGAGGIVTGPDKNIWYADYYNFSLAKMTMSGSTHEYPLTYSGGTHFYPDGIAVGADGKFYLTSSATPLIGVVTTTGTFSKISIPSGDVPYYGGITLGPDGNVWFVEQAHVGKVTPAGVITEYAYNDGQTSDYYGAITSGPDGDLWVTEYNSEVIDDIEPSTGEMTSYSLPCNPYGIVAANDGNLWVACPGALVRVTPSGTATMYNTGFSSYQSVPALTVGPDGNPWFAASNGNEIGEFNIALNQLNIYFPPSSFSTDYAITTGPDGNMWAVDSSQKIDVYILNILKVAPKSLTFTGPGLQQTVSVTQKGTTAWTATTSDATIATVAQGSPANKFVVTSVATGTAKITVSDAVGNLFKVSVTVH